MMLSVVTIYCFQIRIEAEDLYITKTTSKDTGTYTCVADNQLDSDNVTAVLEVKGRLSCLSSSCYSKMCITGLQCAYVCV